MRLPRGNERPRQAVQGALQAGALPTQRLGRAGAANRRAAGAGGRDRRRGDLPNAGRRAAAGADATAAILPDHAAVPLAWPARPDSTAHQMVDRLWRADHHRRVRARYRHRSSAGVAVVRAAARAHPIDDRSAACRARVGLLIKRTYAVPRVNALEPAAAWYFPFYLCFIFAL